MQVVMKRFWFSSLIFVFLFGMSTRCYSLDIVSAQLLLSAEQETAEIEEILLEHIENSVELNVKPTAKSKKVVYPKTEKYTSDFSDNAKYNSIFAPSSQMYMKEEFSQEHKMKIKTGEIGIVYDNKVSQDSFEQMRTLYYEYQQNKFLLNASYKKKSVDFSQKNGSSYLSLAPEYKLTDSLSLKYVYSAKQNAQNSDLVFSLKPFKNNENIYFDFGAGRVYYEDKAPTKSQFVFSTEFEF